ncbi:MAG: glycosyltransferase family 4 protein [Bacteroidetes bacterium]|nr:glycosyltransferase family 4 protein [Bacteroidota bacterium]
MRILILTQYFPPETGAPQNRLFETAVRLKNAGDQVEILTAMPNYPKNKIFDEYRGKWFLKEFMLDMPVYRSFVYTGKSRSIISRLLNYFSFVFSSLIAAGRIKGRFDYVICESPPLFLGLSAVWISRRKRAKLIFNVSDLWPESAEKLGIISNIFLLSSAEKLELWLYKKAFIVSGQTQGIIRRIRERTEHKRLYWLPNGVDPQFFNPDETTKSWRTENGFEKDDFLLLYAGIIGHAQGLEVIINAASKLENYSGIKFLLVGDGPEKEKLEKLVAERNCKQVYFFPNQEKKQMPAIVNSCNMTIVPLKRLPLFEGAIPSKIFENLAMKVPVILGVEGEAKNLFIDEGKAGSAFDPENSEDLAQKVLYYFNNPQAVTEAAESGRNYVLKKFNRDKLAGDFRTYLLQNVKSEI